MQSSCRSKLMPLCQRLLASKPGYELIGQRYITSSSSRFGSPMHFSFSRRQFSDKVTKVTQTVIDKQEPRQVEKNAQQDHFSSRAPTDFDKKILVRFGKYKSVEEVPSLVSLHSLNSARNKFRIFVNLIIGGCTVAGCIVMIYRGRKGVGKGDTLAEYNMKRHPQHYKEHIKD